MMPPYLSFHSKAYCRNSERDKSLFLMPFSFSSICTTLASVAMEAWSLPGTQQALNPLMRALRTRMSCTVELRVCPMCNTPVTLGGGMTTVNGFLLSGVLLKYFFAFQCWLHLLSAESGL